MDSRIEGLCRAHMFEVCARHPDPSHDILHVDRVVALAKWLCVQEGGDPAVAVPAAYLHDCVVVPKDDPRRAQASRLSGERAVELLRGWGYAEDRLEAVRHAVESHSFSAALEARSLEARIVQDADRLDAMGAIGIMRCAAYSGLARRPFYAAEDPFAETRGLDDQRFTLDHFYVKLLKLAERLQTPSAKSEGLRRHQALEAWLSELRRDVLGPREGHKDPP